MTKWYNRNGLSHRCVLSATVLAAVIADTAAGSATSGSTSVTISSQPTPGKFLRASDVAAQRSDNQTSPAERLLRPRDRRTLTSRLPDRVQLEIDLCYGKAGDRNLMLDVLRLKRRTAVPVPAVIYIHGGGWTGGTKSKILPMLLQITEEGFVCFSIDYRLTGEATFPAQIQDCRQAVRWVREHWQELGIDPNRIGVCGGSAGGHLAALLGTSDDTAEFDAPDTVGTTSSRVQAVVNCFGPTDLPRALNPQFDQSTSAAAAAENRMIARRIAAVTRLLGGNVESNMAIATRASPIHWVSNDDPPFLFIHGDSDTLVPLNQSRIMHEALEKAGVESRVRVITGGRHAFISPDATQDAVAFFKQHLGNPNPG